MSRISAAVFWLLLTPLFPTSRVFSAEPKWIHVPSSDFEIFSSAGESDTRRVLLYFERVRTFFDASASPTSRQRTEPVRVIVFGSRKEYDQYRFNEFADAYYTQVAGRDYIVLSSASDNVFPTAVHEYVHRVVQHLGLNLPPWLNEGMAELYSTLKPQGDKVIVGNIIPGRVYEMQQEKWVPLSVILAADSHSPYYNEKNKAGSLYNESWALTHMLALSPEYGDHFRELFLRIAQGTPSQTAIESVYNKPLAAVEKDVQSYLRRDTFSGRVFSVKLGNGEKATVEPAQPFDIKLALLDLYNQPGKEAESRRGLTDLAHDFPKRPEPRAGLGYLDWRAGRQDDAVQEFAAAFELGGRNPQMLWDYGRMVANSNHDAAERALSSLLEDQPSRVDVRLALAQVLLQSHKPGAVLSTLGAVKSVTPADAPRFFQLSAFAKLELGNPDVARADAVQWQSNAKDPDDRERATSFIQSIDGRRRMTPSPPVAADFSQAVTSDIPNGEPPTLKRSDAGSGTIPAERVLSPLPSVKGSFEEMDCSGAVPKIILQTAGARVALLLDAPDKVIISGSGAATVDLHCGRQNPVPAVTIRYDPAAASQQGVTGGVRTIQFGSENPAR
jgi:tetratricopeptide (TPR) repeat protein